jgi:hypothetical protein
MENEGSHGVGVLQEILRQPGYTVVSILGATQAPRKIERAVVTLRVASDTEENRFTLRGRN